MLARPVRRPVIDDDDLPVRVDLGERAARLGDGLLEVLDLVERGQDQGHDGRHARKMPRAAPAGRSRTGDSQGAGRGGRRRPTSVILRSGATKNLSATAGGRRRQGRGAPVGAGIPRSAQGDERGEESSSGAA